MLGLLLAIALQTTPAVQTPLTGLVRDSTGAVVAGATVVAHTAPGREVQAGKSCATVESGKWVGPAKSAAGGEVVAVNDELVNKPSLANEDPYANWMVVIKPADWDAVKPTLVPGTAVAGPYEAKMAADGFAGCACKG